MPVFQCPFSAAADLDQTLTRARSLLQSGEFDACLDVLAVLEKKYVRAVGIFELLGELHLKLGNLEEGIRYKTLYETLRGTLQIAGETRKAYRQDVLPARECEAPPVGETEPEWPAPAVEPAVRPEFRSFAPEFRPDVLMPKTGGLFPVTTAMGEEFVRQGHFDRAVAIYEQLLKRHPEDEGLKTSLNNARRKMREKKMLGVLQTWLSNIEKMKSSRRSKR
ncbi:MAG: tetratricopeptide repeat protein [Desulfomonile sp.]|nr:tetratricopeptide repeat protein [Desulfomonile sp.]